MHFVPIQQTQTEFLLTKSSDIRHCWRWM